MRNAIRTFTKVPVTDFESLGYNTMLETRDEGQARTICALRLQAYEHELTPEAIEVGFATKLARGRHHGLWSQLYDRDNPVRDARMIALHITAMALPTLALVAFVASLAGHVTTFYLFGMGEFWSAVLGIGLTGITIAVGYLAHDRILVRHAALELTVIAMAFALCFWGLLEMAQARGSMSERLLKPSSSAQSFVDDGTPEEDQSSPPAEAEQTIEQHVKVLVGSAMVKIMLSADIILGLLIGVLIRLRSDEDYAAWRELKDLTNELQLLERQAHELTSLLEIAKRRCMAGLLRAKSKLQQSRKSVPYHQALPLLVFCLLLLSARAWSQEGTLVDLSGSVAQGGMNSELFRDYLVGVKKLLLTEPPNTRVWVAGITTQSFGTLQPILKGWTPDAQGVFVDDLNRARHQLASTFEKRSKGLSATSQGTDIFGALWQMKTLFESEAPGHTGGASRTIFIFSDMVNETLAFPAPALLAMGPERMLERAKASGLLVPLHGYKIYVLGASTSGLTPQSWNALKQFWTLYFQEAGAELVTYSAECTITR